MLDGHGVRMRVAKGMSCVHGDGSSEPRTPALLSNPGAAVIRDGGVSQPLPMCCESRTCKV